jgi:acyl-CoA thioesterase-1
MNPVKAILLFLFFPLLLLHVECANAETPQRKILVMGDSIGFGLGVPTEKTWVHMIAQQVKVKHQLDVINASVSGESSAGGKQRLAALLAAHKPALVIIELGGNDGMRGKSLKEMEENLQAMITASDKAGAKVLLLGMYIPGNYGPRYTREFAETYPRLAKTNALAFLPFLLDGVALDPTLMQDDRMHPNAKAQPRLLQNVMSVLQPVLDTQFTARKH